MSSFPTSNLLCCSVSSPSRMGSHLRNSNSPQTGLPSPCKERPSLALWDDKTESGQPKNPDPASISAPRAPPLPPTLDHDIVIADPRDCPLLDAMPPGEGRPGGRRLRRRRSLVDRASARQSTKHKPLGVNGGRRPYRPGTSKSKYPQTSCFVDASLPLPDTWITPCPVAHHLRPGSLHHVAHG